MRCTHFSGPLRVFRKMFNIMVAPPSENARHSKMLQNARLTGYASGNAENARQEFERHTKIQGWNLTDRKMADNMAWPEINRHMF